MSNVHPTYRGVSVGLQPSVGSDRDNDPIIYAVDGAPSGGALPTGQVLDATQSAVALRSDGAAGTTVYVTVNGGTAWTALASATVTNIADSAGLYWGAGSDFGIVHDGTTGVQFQMTDNDADALEFKIGALGAVLGGFDTTTGDIRFELFDDVSLAIGTGGDDLIVHDGTDTTWTHATGDLVFDNTLVTGSTIFQLGTDTNATSFEVKDNTGNIILSVDGDSAVRVNDSVTLELGTGADESLAYDGTDFLWTHASGEFIIDVSGATDSAIIRLGTDTNATDFQVQNDSAAAILSVDGDGAVRCADSVTLEIGAGADYTLVHDGTKTTQAGALQTGVTTVDMANAEHTMVISGAGANQSDITANTWFVDPNGGAQTLVMPAEAAFIGRVLVVNTADAAEAVTIQDDAKGYTIIVLDQNQAGWIACDGTTWYGFMGSET